MLTESLALIAAEQSKHTDSPHIQMMGEQLKDICRREPKAAELVAQDLQNPDMGLDKLKKTFDDFARNNKKGNEACITPAQGDQLIRTFYGFPKPEDAEVIATQSAATAPVEQGEPHALVRGKALSIFDFM